MHASADFASVGSTNRLAHRSNRRAHGDSNCVAIRSTDGDPQRVTHVGAEPVAIGRPNGSADHVTERSTEFDTHRIPDRGAEHVAIGRSNGRTDHVTQRCTECDTYNIADRGAFVTISYSVSDVRVRRSRRHALYLLDRAS